METVIEARPVGNRAGLHSSGTIIEAKPVAEVLDTVIEAQPVIEDENSHKVHETLAATQVRGFFKALLMKNRKERMQVSTQYLIGIYPSIPKLLSSTCQEITPSYFKHSSGSGVW